MGIYQLGGYIMNKTEIAEIITKEAEKRGHKNLLFNEEMIQELKQSAYMKQRNCLGLKVYALWYKDKVFILSVWANGMKRLTVLENVIMAE